MRDKIQSISIIFPAWNKNENLDTLIQRFSHSNVLLSALKSKVIRPNVIPYTTKMSKKKGKGFHYKGKEFSNYTDLPIKESALHRLSGIQAAFLLYIAALLFTLFLIDWHATIELLVAVLTIYYFADLLFNLFLIYRSFAKEPAIHITDKELAKLVDKNLPRYTVFCPLYKEWQIIPQFIDSMSILEYPKDKLQVMLLLEDDDKETINKVKEMNLPAYFEYIIVPHSKPKTKPKACNYGLQFATGEYTVIYDAEDQPDPLQLKKALLAFKKAGEKTICIQAKLNFYNPNQNILTRLFTAEYSLWFDLVLTGLQSINAPIPLGGTSNHFRTKNLFKLKGWDSFNVTEDADLGIRLVKQGFTTAIVDSITLEEANSSISNWYFQRSRWIKGYMQTYLVHTRNIAEAIDKKYFTKIFIFQFLIGGKILSLFINPLMWTLTISYFVLRPFIGTFIESFFPPPILYMGVFALIFGNFLYLYYYMIGCAKHGHDEIVKYLLLVPFYWLAMSVASWMALYKLILAPHHWSKTRHGLHLEQSLATDADINTWSWVAKLKPAFKLAENN